MTRRLATKPGTPLDERFRRLYKPDDRSGCWLWDGAKTSGGYGKFRFATGRNKFAHRWAYERYVGVIPHGMTIDHLCNTPGCVRPSHMRVATQRDNNLRSQSPPAANARKTICVHGHTLTPENVYIRRDGKRQCRTCKRRRDREHLVKRARNEAEHAVA